MPCNNYYPVLEHNEPLDIGIEYRPDQEQRKQREHYGMVPDIKKRKAEQRRTKKERAAHDEQGSYGIAGVGDRFLGFQCIGFA